MQKKNQEPQLKRRDFVTWDTVAQKEKMRLYAKKKGLPVGTWLKMLAIEEVDFIEQKKV